MASPYTQNIEQSQVYKRATGEDRNILDDVLDISQELKSKADNRLAENMEKLQRDNVFEIQAAKNRMRNLNEISKIQEEIQAKYNNDVRAWAEAREKNAMVEEARNKYGANNAEDAKIDIRFPEEAYGEVFNTRVDNVVRRYNDLINDLEGKGLPYRDLEKGDKFIDDVYQGIYDNLTDYNSTNVFNNLGSIFRGQGLNAPDAKSLKTQFNARVAMSNLSDIETINEKWKALYSLSPGLAADYKKIITDKSIVRKDVEFVTDDEVFSKQVRDEKTGRIIDRKYKMSYMQYIDKDGTPTRTEPVEILLREQEDLTEASLAEREVYISLLKPEGKKQFLDLIDDENYTPTKAFKDLRQAGFAKSDEELQETATRRNLAANITELFADKQATYFTEDPMGKVVERADIALWRAGKGPRPLDYFASEKEYARHLLGQQIDIIYGQQITMKDITSELILDEGLAERIDAGGGDSTTFREMLDSEEMTTRYKNALQVVGSNEEALTQRYVVGQFEADERFGAINENGSYFGRPMSNDDKIMNGLIILPDESFLPASVKAQMEQNPNITPIYFKDVGLEDVITNEYDVTFDKPVHVGWNVRDKKLVFKSVDMGRTTDIVDNVEDKDDSWISWGNAINAAMLLVGGYAAGPKVGRVLSAKAIQTVGKDLVKKVTVKKAKNLKTQMDSILFNKKDLFGSPPIKKFANTEKGNLAKNKYIRKWQQREISNLDPNTIRKTILESPWYKSLSLENKTIVKASLDSTTKYKYNAPINIGTKAFRNSLGKEALTVQYGREAFRQVAPKTTKVIETAAKNKKTVGGGILAGSGIGSALYRRAFEDIPEEK